MLASSKQSGNTVRSKRKTVSRKNSSNHFRNDLTNNGITARITNRDWRKEVNELKPFPFNGLLTDLPTNVIKCRLFSKTGYHLQMRANGAVYGTLNQNSKYSKCTIKFTHKPRQLIVEYYQHWTTTFELPFTNSLDKN